MLDSFLLAEKYKGNSKRDHLIPGLPLYLLVQVVSFMWLLSHSLEFCIGAFCLAFTYFSFSISLYIQALWTTLAELHALRTRSIYNLAINPRWISRVGLSFNHKFSEIFYSGFACHLSHIWQICKYEYRNWIEQTRKFRHNYFMKMSDVSTFMLRRMQYTHTHTH